MVSKQHTKKTQTKLMKLVRKRATLICECYRGPSLDADKNVRTYENIYRTNKTKQTSKCHNRV